MISGDNAARPQVAATAGANKEFAQRIGGCLPKALEILGDWEGRLEQKGLKPFRVTATITSLESPKRNVVHYGRIDCSGNWDFLGRRGPPYRFREVIDRGRGGECKGAGTVTLTPSGTDRLDYEFRGGGIESSGSIVRR